MVGARVPPRSTALGTLAHPRAAGAHWRAGTNSERARPRAAHQGHPLHHLPTRLVEIVYTALQLLCHRHAGRNPASPNALRLTVWQHVPFEPSKLVRYFVRNVFKRIVRLSVGKCARRLTSLLVSLLLHNQQSGCACHPERLVVEN